MSTLICEVLALLPVWGEVVFAPFMVFDMIPDWTQLLQYKTISPRLDALACHFTHDAIGISSDPVHDRRFLTETGFSKKVQVKALLGDCWTNAYPIFERMFEMSHKESRWTRMSACSTTQWRLWNSVIERNIAKEVLPPIGVETMNEGGPP